MYTYDLKDCDCPTPEEEAKIRAKSPNARIMCSGCGMCCCLCIDMNTHKKLNEKYKLYKWRDKIQSGFWSCPRDCLECTQAELEDEKAWVRACISFEETWGVDYFTDKPSTPANKLWQQKKLNQ